MMTTFDLKMIALVLYAARHHRTGFRPLPREAAIRALLMSTKEFARGLLALREHRLLSVSLGRVGGIAFNADPFTTSVGHVLEALHPGAGLDASALSDVEGLHSVRLAAKDLNAYWMSQLISRLVGLLDPQPGRCPNCFRDYAPVGFTYRAKGTEPCRECYDTLSPWIKRWKEASFGAPAA